MMEMERVPGRVVEDMESGEMEEEEMEMMDENGKVPLWTIGGWVSGQTMDTDESNGGVPGWSLDGNWVGEGGEKVLSRGKRSTLVPTWTFEKEKTPEESV
jgi:hypothetical protein